MSPLDRKGNWFADESTWAEASVAAGARVATGTSANFNTDDADSIEATLVVTAASGTTPTLDVTLETSMDEGATWDTVGAFSQQTAPGSDGHVFGPLGDVCRWRWAIAGTTPSFNFHVDATQKK